LFLAQLTYITFSSLRALTGHFVELWNDKPVSAAILFQEFRQKLTSKLTIIGFQIKLMLIKGLKQFLLSLKSFLKDSIEVLVTSGFLLIAW
jgi:hypothetical protein